MRGNKKVIFIILLLSIMANQLSAKLAYNTNRHQEEKGPLFMNEIRNTLLREINDIENNPIYKNTQVPEDLIKAWTSTSNFNTVYKNWTELDYKMFRLLSLTSAPKPATSDLSFTSNHLYMRHIYNLTTQGPVTVSQVGDFVLKNHHRKFIDSSHRIVSFRNVLRLRSSQNSYQRLWFNVSEVHMDGILDFAELMIYKKSQSFQKFIQQNDKFTIKFYSCSLQKINGSHRITRFAVQDIMTNDHGWLSFNITNRVRAWFKNSSFNCGIWVKSSNPSLVFQDNSDTGKHPFVVAYFRNSVNEFRQPQRDIQSRIKRDSSSENENCCRTETMMIDFKELGYDQFILHPTEYDGKHCTGNCLFPRIFRAQYFPHTVLQSLMHQTNPKIPVPTCSPSKLGTVSVLYFDENKVSVHHVSNMTIDECACY